MDFLAVKGILDQALVKACFLLLSALLLVFAFLKFREYLGRSKNFMLKHGWSFVIVFFVCSAWATYMAFPTSEEKQSHQERQRQQNAFVNIDTQPIHFAATPDKLEIGNARTLATVLSDGDFERGFVLTRIGTNEVFDFSAPADAIVCDDWRAFGAAEDWVYVSGEVQGERGEIVDMRIHSDGWMRVLSPTSMAFAAREYYPLKTSLGIVPMANWQNIAPSSCLLSFPSCFWRYLTPSNTLVMTWQNALFNREQDLPISFQVEYFSNGNFIYRYDLASIRVKLGSGEYSDNWYSNVVIGAANSASYLLGLCDESLDASTLSSFSFSRLERTDSPGGDCDGDRLFVEEELFEYRTDPYNPDSDYDGLSDYDEIFEYASDPNNPYSINPIYPDGFAVILGDLDPFSCPSGSTNTVYEHIFYTGTSCEPFHRRV